MQQSSRLPTPSGFTSRWQRAATDPMRKGVIPHRPWFQVCMHVPRPTQESIRSAARTVGRQSKSSRVHDTLTERKPQFLGVMNIPAAGIKQKSRYNFNSCSGLCILVGPARFELATNGLKVRTLNTSLGRMVEPFCAVGCLIRCQLARVSLPIRIRFCRLYM